ncbi:hypothetical protein CLV58_1316 [Spirosoma oryzae]|uniref:DUF6922 domain-containing protein n=1 Tax=Spirosoma oryzae TaxID=1469603 RepID=A0A2T0S2Z0_9BACT|nr:hypothetical protein [Spirosoma oryzae]PRY27788.1 hypothetical protein CLV58_1316 [Spirosoma oryzae]
MKEKPFFLRQIFWSDKYDALDVDTDGDYMIARVFDAGTYADMQKAIAYYGMPRVKAALLQAADLQQSTVALVSLWLNCQPEQFYCTKRRKGSSIPHRSF